MKLLSYFLLCVLAVTMTTKGQAQYPAGWKKRVGRTINLAEKGDTLNHKLVNQGSDSLLVQILTSAVKSGKLPAYQTFDAFFSTKIVPNNWEFPPGGEVDSQLITDPETGENVVRIRLYDDDWNSWQKLRILEDWTFYPTTGRTEIQIVAIGPVKDIYGNAGDYRGQIVGFWIKYNDAKNIIERYEQYHPNNTISQHIWKDYFLSDTKPSSVK